MACEKRFNMTSGLEIAGHELFLIKERTGFVWPVTRDSSRNLALKVQDMNITTKSDCKVVLNQRANKIHVCGL